MKWKIICKFHPAETFFYAFFVQGRWQPTRSQLIQIYSVDWTAVYETHNIEHRTEPAIKVSADN